MKYLEACWLWLQQQTRAKELHVGTVDTELNSADLVTKFHPRRRFVWLLMMLPHKVAIGLMTGLGAVGCDTKLNDGWNREGLTTCDGSPEEKKKKRREKHTSCGTRTSCFQAWMIFASLPGFRLEHGWSCTSADLLSLLQFAMACWSKSARPTWKLLTEACIATPVLATCRALSALFFSFSLTSG